MSAPLNGPDCKFNSTFESTLLKLIIITESYKSDCPVQLPPFVGVLCLTSAGVGVIALLELGDVGDLYVGGLL